MQEDRFTKCKGKMNWLQVEPELVKRDPTNQLTAENWNIIQNRCLSSNQECLWHTTCHNQSKVLVQNLCCKIASEVTSKQVQNMETLNYFCKVLFEMYWRQAER